MTAGTRPYALDVERFAGRVTDRVRGGARFCGLFASAADPAGVRLLAVLAEVTGLRTETAVVPADAPWYPTLTLTVPGATWYEREIHDLFGLEAVGHPRLDALVLPSVAGSRLPCPGSGAPVDPVALDVSPLPPSVRGEGVFTIPYGPVRSGVFESIEYLVETQGEDIPHLRTRVFHKHRGMESRFEGMDAFDGVLLAERYEGVASVAHAIAFSTALERLGQVDVPEASGLVRVVHAELERVANHLDSSCRHAEAAGQAVAFARLSLHKERVQRLRAALCGNRFGRGVVVPGGVTGGLRLSGPDVFEAIDKVDDGIRSDLRLLMATPSFVDRLRGTGTISPDLAREWGALGPVGRGSGQTEDVRVTRPYAAYGWLGHQLVDSRVEGDALARQRVRIDEIAGAFHLLRQAVDRLEDVGPETTEWAVPFDGSMNGEALGWAEAPQGEVLALVSMDGGRLTRVKPRSASFHNLGLFHAAFPNDILTDFAFVEASFGLSIAGAAG
jgi:formate hydrogenlyase subunit 5